MLAILIRSFVSISLFPIPVGIVCRIVKLLQDFLCGGVGDKFKFHLVKWNKIREPLQCGELGIGNLILFNQTLLGNSYGIMEDGGRCEIW